MSRIPQTFKRLAAAGRKALIPYFTAGDPDPAVTVPLMHAAVAGGADIIELGVPFSDPMADGPVIQRASERALAHGVGMPQVLAMVGEFRKTDRDTPVVLMGYANPIEAMGTESFVRAAKAANVDGVIVVDYPPEECKLLAGLLRENSVDLIFLIAPTSTDQRIAQIAALATGYVYYVSLRGVTGAANLDLGEVASRLGKVRAKTDLPIGVGFGIRDGATARAIGQIADAVIIGSRVIQEIEAAPGNAPLKVKALLGEIRAAMDLR
ncbi:MAG: tryptophan synthase subunit alpha [Betaproteobacteria bacterium RIFCSPLOWO2_02_FULL_62_17]|nr:MAG: tryptophan synthase subunit alpha [Betaproteobacteria bacterium RIFCSPLOWO2_02_FULL_62_17]